MDFDSSQIFHQISKNHKKHELLTLESGDQDIPKEWKTVYYKTYPRLPKCTLSTSHGQNDLFGSIEKRRSRRDFAGVSISPQNLSTLLQYSCGIVASQQNGNPVRAQPSGGARYPIEIYPIVLVGNEEIDSGIYHYDVKHHQLDVLGEREFSESDLAELTTHSWSKNVSVLLILTAVFDRTQQKYGERGYRYALIEAGHIGQNICLVSEHLDLKCCPFGGTEDRAIEQLLDIDGSTETVAYALALGG